MQDIERLRGPLFVVGTPRSGTTLTADILGRHPSLLMPGENHFFEDIFVRWSSRWPGLDASERNIVVEQLATIYGRYNQLEDQPRIDALFQSDPQLRTQLAMVSTLGEMLDLFMSAQLAGTQRTAWGNNTPKDIFHFENIDKCFPESRFVICARDPRDFLLSYKGRWQVTSDSHKERLAVLYQPILTSLLWKATMRQAQRLRHQLPQRVAVVHYEALVSDPHRAVEELCNTIGIEFNPNMLAVERNNSSTGAASAGIFSTSIGRWREGLTAEEVYVLQSIAGKEMKAWGYDLAACSPRLVPLTRIILAFPVRAIQAFVANRANRGPTLPYIMKRLRALVSGSR